MHSVSDETLMAQVRSDELRCLTPLFERYHGPIFNFLYRLTNDRDTSEDLAQNVFYRILKYRNSYQPPQPFRAWIYQLARNVHADHWQRQQQMRTSDIDVVERTGAFGNAAYAQMATVDRQQGLQEALALLPPAQREILVLHRYQGFDYEEIGEMLGCSAGAAKVKAHRALQALRKIYFA
ncbi:MULTISPECIES: RNA polymerase sigma factor [Hymenobacter]|uniref:RNA polymerase sigma factor n=1 Tax=Hymenobacter jejuensis TaxID=2502781 RepID=A0A5B8A2Q5_9BACT|nr:MULTISPECIES: RNA polymerase sigma factor [Hymenobacter]MBC6990600.1 RNA polymerase sigma factor [Hymenobacter sp. BT491]QDA60986.1 RNA polymerase sigma factor [Hymenobacter jejuensis]